MKQIAILHYSAPPRTGSVENVLYHHIRLLHEAGYPLRVIAAQGDEAYYETSYNHEVDFFKVPEMEPAYGSGEVAGQTQDSELDSAAFRQAQAELMESLQPLLEGVELCIVHDILTDGRHPPLADTLHNFIQQGKMRFIAWCHDLPSPDISRRITSFSPVVRYVTPEEHLRSRLAVQAGLDEQDILVIPSGIDQAAFLKWEIATQELARELDLHNASPLLLLPGEISSPEDVEFAIRVTIRLRETFPQAALIITEALDEPYPAASTPSTSTGPQALRQELAATGFVHFLSGHSLAGVPSSVSGFIRSDFYCLADLILLPGTMETYDLPLLGAALMRLPVFASNHLDLQEVAGGAMYFYPADGGPEIVAEAIATHLAQDKVYANRQYVLRHLTWQTILERYLIPLIETSGNRTASS